MTLRAWLRWLAPALLALAAVAIPMMRRDEEEMQ